jgi:hypothetical protein
LRDFRSVQWQHLGDVYAVTFDRGGTTTTVLWTMSRRPTRFTVNAIAPQATLVDEQGNTRALAAEGKTYTIELPGAICTQADNCFIGGAPRLLVEAGSPADRPSLVPVAHPTPTPAALQATPILTPTLLPSPSAPQTPTLTPQPPSQAATPIPTPTRSVTVAQNPSLLPSPQPAPTPLPPITPLTVFTPSRCLILILVGLVVFTVIYGIQVALWWRRRQK